MALHSLRKPHNNLGIWPPIMYNHRQHIWHQLVLIMRDGQRRTFTARYHRDQLELQWSYQARLNLRRRLREENPCL